MADRDWHGSVFPMKGTKHLYVRMKVHGEWKTKATPFVKGQEAEAEAFRAELRDQILAAEAAMQGQSGPVTVRAWAKRWLETRKASRRDDDSILTNHVLPEIGSMLLDDVASRHILDMVEKWQPKNADGNRAPGAAAPRTVRNWYSTTACMFRDAALRGLIKTSPCMLRTPHLPSAEDADSEWRITASFKRGEVETLISTHAEIEEDATVTYATLSLGAMRHGEMAALRWRHMVDREPLSGLLVANSNARRRTKKGKTRLMPIHPTLAAVLAEWKLTGWARLMGRAPTDDDLILPLPLQLPSGRRVAGKRPELQVGEDSRRRTKDFTWKRLSRHLEVLKLRHRRVHDWRRTFVSLATADGADDRILQWGTHGRPGDIMSAYNDSDWRRLCGEVLKLKIARRGSSAVRPLRPEPVPQGGGALPSLVEDVVEKGPAKPS